MTPLLLALAMQASAAAPVPGLCGRPDPCQRGARPGELAIVFLGDSGFGEGGASEWGPHSQGEVATRLASLCPRPDLVLFLGDNVYWRGSPDLFGPRFDTMYAPLFDAEQRRVHAALGNHDVKGCQLTTQSAFGAGETCADALTRMVVEDVKRDEASLPALLSPEVMERARTTRPEDCPSGSDLAYEQAPDTGTACYAQEALRHRAFGYLFRGGAPLRYYSLDAPTPPAPGTPRVRVFVTDSNTLRRGPGPPPGRPSEKVLEPEQPEGVALPPERWDSLQALWLENQMATADASAWKIVVGHHPAWSPRGCAFRVLGKCFGGHGDDESVQRALFPVFARQRPDLVVGAHNHFYARSRALDGAGYKASSREPGVRYFVTGGGGGPLYRMQPLHSRYAAGGRVPPLPLHEAARRRGLLLGHRRERPRPRLGLLPARRKRGPLHHLVRRVRRRPAHLRHGARPVHGVPRAVAPRGRRRMGRRRVRSCGSGSRGTPWCLRGAPAPARAAPTNVRAPSAGRRPNGPAGR